MITFLGQVMQQQHKDSYLEVDVDPLGDKKYLSMTHSVIIRTHTSGYPKMPSNNNNNKDSHLANSSSSHLQILCK